MVLKSRDIVLGLETEVSLCGSREVVASCLRDWTSSLERGGPL